MVSSVLPSADAIANPKVLSIIKAAANAPLKIPGIYFGPASSNMAKENPPAGQKMVTLDSMMENARPSFAMPR